MQKPLILVTNDDGVKSPGLTAAVRVARRLGEVVVVSTRDPQTAMGRSYPKQADIGVVEEFFEQSIETTFYSVVGSPAQAVSYAILEFCPRKPDICLSGINFGENLGTTLTGSGTLGAAFEADSYDIPSLAVSLAVLPDDTEDSIDWSGAEFFALKILNGLLRSGWPEGSNVLNVNVPPNADESTEIRSTIDSRQPYFVFHKPNRVAFSSPTKLPVEIEFDASTLERNSDIQALILDGVVSVTAIRKQVGLNFDVNQLL